MKFTIRTFRGFADKDSIQEARKTAIECVLNIASDGFDETLQWANIEDNEKRVVHVIRWIDNVAGF